MGERERECGEGEVVGLDCQVGVLGGERTLHAATLVLFLVTGCLNELPRCTACEESGMNGELRE